MLVIGLLLVNMLNQHTLVLEHVTLGLKVKFTVQMTVNLLALPVLLQEPPKDTHPLHPEHPCAGSGVLGTLPLTMAGVTTLTASQGLHTTTVSGVDSDGLLDNQTLAGVTTLTA